MASPLSILPPISFRLGAGPFLIENSVAIFLLGILVSQCYLYGVNYKKDPTWMKTWIYAVCFIETLSTVFAMDTTWSYFVVEFEDILTIAHIVWSAGAILVVDMVVVALVQGFPLTKRVLEVIGGTDLTQPQLYCNGYYIVLAAQSLCYRVSDFSVSVTLNIGLTLAVVVDILTTGVLIYYLLKQGARVRSTKHIVHGLMVYAVNTGALTIIFSLATLLSFNFVHYSFMFAGFVLIETKVYANSLLAMHAPSRRLSPDTEPHTPQSRLNARNRIKHSNSLVNSIPLTTRLGHTVGTNSNNEPSGRAVLSARQLAFEIVSMTAPSDASTKPTVMGDSNVTVNTNADTLC